MRNALFLFVLYELWRCVESAALVLLWYTQEGYLLKTRVKKGAIYVETTCK